MILCQLEVPIFGISRVRSLKIYRPGGAEPGAARSPAPTGRTGADPKAISRMETGERWRRTVELVHLTRRWRGWVLELLAWCHKRGRSVERPFGVRGPVLQLQAPLFRECRGGARKRRAGGWWRQDSATGSKTRRNLVAEEAGQEQDQGIRMPYAAGPEEETGLASATKVWLGELHPKHEHTGGIDVQRLYAISTSSACR